MSVVICLMLLGTRIARSCRCRGWQINRRLNLGDALLLIIGNVVVGINTTILTGARVSFAMGDEGFFWPRVPHIHADYGTPSWALLCQCLLSCLLVLSAPSANCSATWSSSCCCPA